MKYFLLGSLWSFFIVSASAQVWDKEIDATQKQLCSRDSLNNCIVKVSTNDDVNLAATSFLIDKVDHWQKYISTSKQFTPVEKNKYSRILLSYVKEFAKYTKRRSTTKYYSVNLSKELFGDFDKTIEAHQQKYSMNELIKNKGILAATIIVNNEFASTAKDHAMAKAILEYEDCLNYPEKIVQNLNKNPNIKNADSLIVLAAYKNHDKVYDYAQCANCKVNAIIKRSEHPLVKTIYKMAQMETGRSLTPFLDAIGRGEITIDTINSLAKDPHKYFKLLTNMRISYSKRLANGETILAIENFNKKIEEKALEFVKEINELHTASDGVRFTTLNPLNDIELYYIAVYGAVELYTSSFNRGVFAQLVNKLNGKNTNDLLNVVNNDYFRKFVKVSAGYNQLARFLRLMPDSNAKELMNRFVSDLANNDNDMDIEDAVDVADAYVGIGSNNELKTVSEQIQTQIKYFQRQHERINNTKGKRIYSLLDKIFEAYRDTSKNISQQLGIPSVTTVSYNSIVSNGRTVVKLYFYGDEDMDGQYSYANFMGLFGDKSKWTVRKDVKPNTKADFVEINSVKGKPITIFANYPHYDATKKTDPDDSAKRRMSEYIYKKGLQPNFVMHRGHSYHVPITLEYMALYDTSSKLIVMGSCGSYQNLQSVLNICPDAHIVSSKQTGTMHVNDPMLRTLFEDIGNGKDVIWPSVWPRVKARVQNDRQEMFEEYISPNKNLGMIFIKAYKKSMGV
jgi:hypothetical protein